MTSDRQRESNRANAQHSTGPRTAEGKARSAQNRASHRLTGAHAILPGEDAAAFDHLQQSLFDEFQPIGEVESHLVDELAQNQWKLLRAERMEIAALTRSMESGNGSPALTDEVARLSRYQASIRRAWNNAHTRLRQIQSDRRKMEVAQLDLALTRSMDDSNPVPPNPEPPQPVTSDPPAPPPAPPPPPGSAIGPASQ